MRRKRKHRTHRKPDDTVVRITIYRGRTIAGFYDMLWPPGADATVIGYDIIVAEGGRFVTYAFSVEARRVPL